MNGNGKQRLQLNVLVHPAIRDALRIVAADVGVSEAGAATESRKPCFLGRGGPSNHPLGASHSSF